LIVFRHAKSSWDEPALDDVDRPLNKRGNKNAPEMGRRLLSEGRIPDRIYASPARRARDTARLVARELGIAPNALRIEHALYPGSAEGLLAVVRSFSDDDRRVMIVGHNPALTDFVNDLAGTDIDNVPTAGYAAISFGEAKWAQVAPGSGRMERFDYPKSKRP
jgi:phosphohistidine phosphatase